MWQKSVTEIELFPLVLSGIRAEMREEQQTVMYKAAPVRLSLLPYVSSLWHRWFRRELIIHMPKIVYYT